MKKMSKEDFAKAGEEMKRMRQAVGEMHDRLAKFQDVSALKSSDIVQAMVVCMTYQGPVDLGLQADLDQTSEKLRKELDRRIPIDDVRDW